MWRPAAPICGPVRAGAHARVLGSYQWQTREAGEAAFQQFESGEQDFWQLIRAHQAKTVTFGSFQVLHSLERSHDNALHCHLVG